MSRRQIVMTTWICYMWRLDKCITCELYEFVTWIQYLNSLLSRQYVKTILFWRVKDSINSSHVSYVNSLHEFVTWIPYCRDNIVLTCEGLDKFMWVMWVRDLTLFHEFLTVKTICLDRQYIKTWQYALTVCLDNIGQDNIVKAYCRFDKLSWQTTIFLDNIVKKI